MPGPELRIPVLLRSRAEQRGAPRVAAEMPMQADGAHAVTQDLSASGLRFLSDRAYAAGDRILATIDYLLDGHDYPLECEVEVVHCEPQGGRFSVGARLLAPLAGLDGDALP